MSIMNNCWLVVQFERKYEFLYFDGDKSYEDFIVYCAKRKGIEKEDVEKRMDIKECLPDCDDIMFSKAYHDYCFCKHNCEKYDQPAPCVIVLKCR